MRYKRLHITLYRTTVNTTHDVYIYKSQYKVLNVLPHSAHSQETYLVLSVDVDMLWDHFQAVHSPALHSYMHEIGLEKKKKKKQQIKTQSINCNSIGCLATDLTVFKYIAREYRLINCQNRNTHMHTHTLHSSWRELNLPQTMAIPYHCPCVHTMPSRHLCHALQSTLL